MPVELFISVTAAFLIVVLVISFLAKRISDANRILTIPKPMRRDDALWTTKQDNSLIAYIVVQVNKFQKIENGINYYNNLVKWHTDRVAAYKKKFRKTEAELEQSLANEAKEHYRSLLKDSAEVCGLFKSTILKDKNCIIRKGELSFFPVLNDNSLCRLWNKPRGITSSGSARFIFLPCFVIKQNGRDLQIQEYKDLKLAESYQLERIKFEKTLANDDEIAGEYWLHEKKKGGPDLRYSYNPKSYIVFRGILNVKDYEVEALLKFSNRVKAHKAFSQLRGIINRLSSEDNSKLYKKMLTCDSFVSIDELKLMIEEDKKKSESEVNMSTPFNESSGYSRVEESNSDTQVGSCVVQKDKEEANVILKRERQPKWDKYETALLIEGYFKILNGESRNEVVSDLSEKLRNIATLDGEIVSDTYRNENGIAWQLTYIKKAFGEEGNTEKAPPQIFKEIVELYKNDRDSFDILLQIAHEKCGDIIEQSNLAEQGSLVQSVSSVPLQNGGHGQVDLKGTDDYSHTKPDILSYCGEIDSNISCWNDVYVSLIKSLYEDYPTEIKTLIYDVNYNFISSQAENFDKTTKLDEGVYIESIYEANKVVACLKSLFDYCGVTYDNVMIRYTELQEDDKEDMSSVGEPTSESTHEIIIPTYEVDNNKSNNLTEIDRKIYVVIGKYFKSGCFPGAITYRKIKRYLSEEFFENCELTNDDIQSSLDKSCIFANGKYYASDSLLPDELRTRLVKFLSETLESKGYIYYQTILETFGFELTTIIADVGLLKEYLQNQFDEYYYFDEYVGKTNLTTVNSEKELEQLLLDAVYPVSTEWIYSRLSHLTDESIRKAMLFDPKVIVSNGYCRFHIDSMGFTEEELNAISQLIQEVIDEHVYMFSNELLSLIKTKMGALYERIKDFGDLGIRNAIERKLGDKFRFSGNIVTKHGSNIDNYSVFKAFAEAERYFKLSSVIQLKEQIGVGVIYFEAINEVASRINEQDFVPTETLTFDSQTIDCVIEQFISQEMCSIKNACNFAVYPATCYPWTNYLLETYVAKFSNKFKLIHGSYAEGSSVGAIVKISSPINSMDDVVVSFLTRRTDIDTPAEALSSLVDEGYIARRRYKGIDELLTKAKAKR